MADTVVLTVPVFSTLCNEAFKLRRAVFILEHPDIVLDRRVLDNVSGNQGSAGPAIGPVRRWILRVVGLGAGSGVVGIVARKCGASRVIAAEIDRNATSAIGLNAEANGVTVEVTSTDVLSRAPPDVDVILAGDVFYSAPLAARVLPFLTACRKAGIEVLIGDPRRRSLPLAALRLIAEYAVPDFGDGSTGQAAIGGVFTLGADG
ncbi:MULTISPECIES: class I SAM-dependent methyltransferase [Rhizobium]|uniref:Methyltransferase n=1 Tax=Rhizobium favelukesii TaxID=348824 RepID=W6RB64_9HYPH|nr:MULTISPECIES: 50S ribosomal protein L11 methyltransferase [Rhizobium]MCS0461264.1 methyltransferase [Rhizobium favelukesii]UFS84254.1 methyltransferase [Rhizobium sp. T136]CDM58079.1 hypothetical protein LPU83_2423 [Rhizobium favelukesii]